MDKSKPRSMSGHSTPWYTLALQANEQVLPALLAFVFARRITGRRHGPSVSVGARSALLVIGLLLTVKPVRQLLKWLRGGGPAKSAPGWVPVLGHLVLMGKMITSKEGMWDSMTKIHSEVGKTFRLVIGLLFAPVREFVFTGDAKIVEHILKTNFSNYGKGEEVHVTFQELLGDGIFAVDGEKWVEQRKIAAQIFTRRNFGDNMIRVFQEHARNLISVLRNRADEHPSSEIELQTLLFSLTMDAFCEIGFGLDWQSMENCDEETPAKAGAPSRSTLREFSRHFDAAQQALVGRFMYRPLWRVERFLARRGLLPSQHPENVFAEDMAFINDTISQLLTQRLQNQEVKGADLLSLFLDHTQDPAYLRDIILNFMVAGRDTTACTLTWTFWELSQCPAALARVRAEVTEHATEEQKTGQGASRDFSFKQLNDLKFTTACIRETVRLHPPVPVDAKCCFQDDILPDGTEVSRGNFVFYAPYAMGRDTDLWGSDAATWRPERWMEMEQEPSNFVNSAFQAGPRICLGREMAVLEVRAVLVQAVLAGLQWQARPDYAPIYRYPSIVLPMADPGLPIHVSFPPAAASR